METRARDVSDRCPARAVYPGGDAAKLLSWLTPFFSYVFCLLLAVKILHQAISRSMIKNLLMAQVHAIYTMPGA